VLVATGAQRRLAAAPGAALRGHLVLRQQVVDRSTTTVRATRWPRAEPARQAIERQRRSGHRLARSSRRILAAAGGGER
jgi:hypothetical protein